VLTNAVTNAVGGPYSGAALNPARVLGPSMVFHCYWDTVPVYVSAQLLGAFLAALLTMPLYGFGPESGMSGGQAAVDAEVCLLISSRGQGAYSGL